MENLSLFKKILQTRYKNSGIDKITTIVIDSMSMISSENIPGARKKEFVLDTLRNIIKDDYAEIIIVNMIDIIISVEKGKIRINPKVKKVFSCFGK